MNGIRMKHQLEGGKGEDGMMIGLGMTGNLAAE